MIKGVWIIILSFLVNQGWSQFDQADYDDLLKETYDGSVPIIQPSDLYSLIQKGDKIHILDTREVREYEVSFIKGATQVGFWLFRKEKIKHINKSDTIVLYCTIGARSETIGSRLIKNGFTNVYNLYGGIIQWKNLGYPVINSNNLETEEVHVYSKKWGQWLRKGKPRY